MAIRPAAGRTLTTRARANSLGALAAGLATLALLAVTAQAQQQPGGAQPQAQLPGGAQSVAETYQDWQMVCNQLKGGKHCVVGQQQTDSKTGQRILAVELQPQGDKAEGVLVLPFGLTLDKGVAMRIGEADLGAGLRFKTCFIQGCVVPVSLDAKVLAALRKASALTVSAFGEGDQPMAFSVSLKGFGPAFDRAGLLGR
jgi:invasion protein IalB